MLGAVLGGLNHPMDGRDAQAQWGQGWATLHRAGKCKTSEKGWPSSWNQETTFLQAGHGQRAGIPSGSLSQSGSSAVAAGPALPSRRFICHPGDRWQSGGCRSGDVTLREPRSSLPADKGRGSRYLCQVTNNPPSSRRCERHRIRVRSWERHKRGCCEHRCRCRGARAGCRWGSWVLIGKRENREWE